MQFEDLVGQSALIASLQRDFQSARIVHAYLLTGPAGTGKRTLAKLCAQTLFCRAEKKPCGKCSPCERFLTDNHPDVLHLGEGKSIGVEEIRQVVTNLQQRAFENGYKVVLIENAGTMTVQAQNALLKTLEEPPSQTVFFLITQTASTLLPTIRSRCRSIQLTPLTQEETAGVLFKAGIPQARASLLAAMSGGCVGEALRIQTSDAWWALRERVLHALVQIKGAGDVLLAVQKLREDKEQAEDICAMLTFALQDALHAKLCMERRVEADDAGLGEILQERLTADALCRMLETLIRARKLLASNLPWQQVLEMVLLALAEEMNA